MRDFIYGFHPISALVRQSPDTIVSVYLEKNKKDARTAKLIQLLTSYEVNYQLASRSEIQSKVGDVVHQGVIASVEKPTNRAKADLKTSLKNLDADETLLILDGIVDPANLGGCLRVADAAGVKTVILPKDKSSPVTAVTRKVAAGAAETVNIITVTNVVRTIETLKQHEFWIFGLADETAQSIYKQRFTGRIAIVMGNEGKGLRQLTRQSCDHLLALPMLGQVESLNVAVATGITLYEINRQRFAQ